MGIPIADVADLFRAFRIMFRHRRAVSIIRPRSLLLNDELKYFVNSSSFGSVSSVNLFTYI